MNLRKISRFTILFGKDGSCGMPAIDTRSAIHPIADITGHYGCHLKRGGTEAVWQITQ